MTTDDTTQEVTTDPQAGQAAEPEQPTSGKQPLSHEAALAALEATRKEAAEYRRKAKDIESKLAEAEKAKVAEAERQAAEQGKFQELYEKEKQRAAEVEARLSQMLFDQQRRDAAQAAGIPQLWQRLQGSTPEELAEDAKGLAAMMQPAQPANGQPVTGRPATMPTPQAQGRRELTDEERRARATRTF